VSEKDVEPKTTKMRRNVALSREASQRRELGEEMCPRARGGWEEESEKVLYRKKRTQRGKIGDLARQKNAAAKVSVGNLGKDKELGGGGEKERKKKGGVSGIS